MEHADIIELVEVRLKGANNLLAHGYKLLSVEAVTAMIQNPESQNWYVKKQVVYVMGRPAGVEPFQAGPPAGESPGRHEGLGHGGKRRASACK